MQGRLAYLLRKSQAKFIVFVAIDNRQDSKICLW